MTTVINNPSSEGSGAGVFVGIVVLVIVLAAFFIYGLPALQHQAPANPAANINVTLPAPSGK